MGWWRRLRPWTGSKPNTGIWSCPWLDRTDDVFRRAVREELGITARFAERTGEKPVFLTVTETVGSAEEAHSDVSLWFVLAGQQGQVLRPDPSEFRSVRWSTKAEVAGCGSAMFDPHLPRMPEKVDQLDDLLAPA